VRIGEVTLDDSVDRSDLDRTFELSEASEVRCIDPATEKRMIEAIESAKKAKDSLGGVTELIVSGLPAGLGGFMKSSDRLESKLAAAMMSIQSVKGMEIGDGFASSAKHGSVAHDEIYFDPEGDPKKKGFYRRTNRAGGIEGGMTTGENLVIRVGCKPISTLNRPLDTVDVRSKAKAKAMVERTDNCIVPALGVVCEAAAAMVLAEAFLDKFGSDNFEETNRNYQAWLDWQY
jgi:chorismate synthase